MSAIRGTATSAVKVPKWVPNCQSCSLIKRFGRDEGGNIAIIFGLTTMIMFAVVGGAVDYGRWLSARNQTQAAIDSALLAAGRTSMVTEGDSAKALKAADDYYREMKSKITSDDSVRFVAINSATSFEARGTAWINTPFLNIIGIEKLPVMQSSDVKQAGSTIATGSNSGYNNEVSLMLDTTGSMKGQKLEDLKAAAKDLIDIVVWSDQAAYTSKVAIAPFSDSVNVGSYFNAVTNLNQSAVSYAAPEVSGFKDSCYKKSNPANAKRDDCIENPSDYYAYSDVTAVRAAAPCVVERAGSAELTEAVPGAGTWIPSWNVHAKENTTICPEASAIVPLTNDKAKLKATIDGLVASNYTAGALGTGWAWYLISPEWGTIFTGASKPESYSKLTELGPSGSPKLKKIAILMTDGEYNYWQANGTTVSTVNTKAKALCTNMKAKGIKVYTVGFALGGNTNAINTLSNCASDASTFYNAADGEALKAAFRSIAVEISDLRLTQ